MDKIKQDLIKQFGERDIPKIKINNVLVDDDEKVNEAIEQAELYFKQNLEAINVNTSLFQEPQIDEIKLSLMDYTRWIYSNKDLRMTKQIEDRFKAANKWLSEIKKGTIVLINIQQDEPVSTGTKSINLLRG